MDSARSTAATLLLISDGTLDSGYCGCAPAVSNTAKDGPMADLWVASTGDRDTLDVGSLPMLVPSAEVYVPCDLGISERGPAVTPAGF